MWLFDRLLSASVSYDSPITARLLGPLNLAGLDAAVGSVLARHDSLRTRFPCTDGVPRQVAGDYLRQRPRLADLSGLPAGRRAAEAARLAAREAARPFDLAEGPLCRAMVVRLASDEHVLIVAVHHLAADLWSVALMVNDFWDGYLRACHGRPAAPPPAQATGLAARQRAWLTPARRDRLRGYWRRQLTGSECVPLPTDHPRPRLPNLSSHVFETGLGAELSHELRALAAERGVTLYVLVLAALAALIRRWTGQDSLVTVSVTAGRRGRAAEQAVGMLTECLVLRTNAAGDPPFSVLAAGICEVLLDSFDHSRLPFADIVALADPGRDLEPSPLRQIGFSLHNTPRPLPAETGLAIGALPVIEALPAATGATGISEADLWLEVFDDGEGELLARLQMDDLLFEPETVRLTARRLRTVLQAAVREPGTRISRLPLAGEEERQLLARWSRGGNGNGNGAEDGSSTKEGNGNGTGGTRAEGGPGTGGAEDTGSGSGAGSATAGGPGPEAALDVRLSPGSVPEWLDGMCQRSPDAAAITVGSWHVTYRALAHRAQHLAWQARHAGMRPGDLIGVRARDPAAAVTGALAALYAGAVLVCGRPGGDGDGAVLAATLDPITSGPSVAGGLGAPGGRLVFARVRVPGTTGTLEPGPLAPGGGGPVCVVTADGVPAAFSHSLLLAVAARTAARLGGPATRPAAGPVVLCPEPGQPPDPVDLLLWLLTGRPLMIAGEGPADATGHPDLPGVPGRAVLVVPAAELAWWVAAGWRPPPGAAVVTGSDLPAATADTLASHTLAPRTPAAPAPASHTPAPPTPPHTPAPHTPGEAGTETWVRYTPAGAPGWVAMGRVRPPADTERGRLTLGRPLGVPQVWLLGPAGDPVPVGIRGEVCLAGDLVPSPVPGQPGRTAARFTPDPLGWGARVWRTGDHARFRWDGTLEPAAVTAGRFQVSGYWVDAQEVAAVLAAFPGVAEAAAGLRWHERDGGVVVPGVAAVIVPGAGACPAAEELQEFAAARLPWYAVPSHLARAGAITRLPDGTPDLSQFPLPGVLLPARKLPPATPAGERVAGLVRSLLGVPAVHTDDNFFRLGGTSMDAVRLGAAIGSVFGVKIGLYDLMTAPTLAGITRTVEEACRREAGRSP